MPGIAGPPFSQNSEHDGVVASASTAAATSDPTTPTPFPPNAQDDAPPSPEDAGMIGMAHQPEVHTPDLPQHDGENEPVIQASTQPRPARQPRLRRKALNDASERFTALERNRVDAEMQLAQAVGEIGANLTASTRDSRRLLDAQLASAEAQQVTARLQAVTAREQAEVARVQAEVARVQTEATRVLAEAVRTLAGALLKLENRLNGISRS